MLHYSFYFENLRLKMLRLELFRVVTGNDFVIMLVYFSIYENWDKNPSDNSRIQIKVNSNFVWVPNSYTNVVHHHHQYCMTSNFYHVGASVILLP